MASRLCLRGRFRRALQKRRRRACRVHRLVVAAVSAALQSAGANALVTAGRRPSILFLMADQFRFDILGRGHTPSVDALAADGSLFRSHYTSTPTCTPARAGLLTGLAPWRHGMLGYAEQVPSYPMMLPAVLAGSGYRTMAIGKNHFGWNATTDRGIGNGYESVQVYDGLGNGFVNGSEYDDYDRWFQRQRPGEDPLKSGGLKGWNTWQGVVYEYEESLHPTAWTGRKGVEAIRNLSLGNDPFFLKVSFHRPHSPYDPPQRVLGATSAPPPPAVSTDGWDTVYKNCSDIGRVDPYCGEVDATSVAVARRAYLASAAFVDEQIGQIVDALRESGRLEDTFILFTSDHGDLQMDHFLWRKALPYEGSTHLPLVVRWPKSMGGQIPVRRGSEVDGVTELRDIFPTFLDVAGIWTADMEASVDGRPVTWLLKGRKSAWRKWVDLEHNFMWHLPYWNALTDGQTKYVYFGRSGKEQLFNLTADPQEQRDQASDPDLRAVLQTWRSRMAAQFKDEGRGTWWVDGDRLAVRPDVCRYSPNYPGDPGADQHVGCGPRERRRLSKHSKTVLMPTS